MGGCCCKDGSRDKYGNEGGVNSRHTPAVAERNVTPVPSAGFSRDINTPQSPFTPVRAENPYPFGYPRNRPPDVPVNTRNVPVRNIESASIPFTSESWYFGKIDINRCIRVLGDRNIPDGTFIVRDSSSRSGTFCISVKGESPKGPAIFSIRVIEIKNRLGDKQFRSSIDNMVFPSINDVIKHYKAYGIHSNGVSVFVGEGLRNQHFYMGEDIEEERSLEIKSEDVELKEVLGKGNFGTVWKGIWKKPTGLEVHVAVKKLHESDKEELQNFEKEANVLKLVYHDNVVTFIGVFFEKNQHPVIVTELMSRGDLRKFLIDNRKTALGDLYYFAHQVASGMIFLASKNIIHRDLAARNVLLGEQHIVKIADFGLSRVLREDDIYTASSANPVPIKWTAPEGLGYPRQYSTKSDVWSYGIFLTELITRGSEPYRHVRSNEITKDRLMYQGFRMSNEDLGVDCSVSLYAIMVKCWQSYPDQRPDFKTVAEEIHRLYEPYIPLHQY